jgi:hypothetical protein
MGSPGLEKRMARLDHAIERARERMHRRYDLAHEAEELMRSLSMERNSMWLERSTTYSMRDSREALDMRDVDEVDVMNAIQRKLK